MELYFDGGCLLEKQEARWAFIIKDDEIIYSEHGWVFAERVTNNVAEYTALIKGLEWLNSNEIDEFEVFGDNQMVINMTSGLWGKKRPHKKAPHLRAYLLKCRELLKNNTISWIPRELNIADELIGYDPKTDSYIV